MSLTPQAWQVYDFDAMGGGNGSLGYLEASKDPDATAKVDAWLASPPVRDQFEGRLPAVVHRNDGYGESVEIYTEDLIAEDTPLAAQLVGDVRGQVVAVVLAELCNRDLIPEGDMTVHMWW